MNRKALVLILVLALGAAAVFFVTRSDQSPREKATAGREAPLFEMKDTEGRTWKLADLRGKVVLLNFWATWCDPCREEIPSIQNFINSEKGNEKVIFVSVLYRDDPARAMGYLKERGYSFPVLIDDAKIASSYGVTGVPETFVISTQGVIKDRIIGPLKWDSPEVIGALRKLASDGQ